MQRTPLGLLALPLLPLSMALPAASQSAFVGVQKISDRYGDFPTPLHNGDQLGRSVTALGDLDGDGVTDIASGTHCDDDGGLNRGAVHVMLLRADGTVKATQKISSLAGGFAGPLDDGDQIARGIAGIGDLDGDGIPDLAVGSNFDDDGGPNRGAVWLLFLNRDGSVRAQAKISSTSGGMVGLRNRDEFGRSVCAVGDLDADGVPDLAVGAPYDDAGGANFGAVYLLRLHPDGSVKAQTKIATRTGGFGGVLHGGDLFGFSIAAPGDVDGDGIRDLVVGVVGDDAAGMNAGAAYVLFLAADGTVRAETRIGPESPAFAGFLEAGDQLGTSCTAIGDLDGDGRAELAIGAVKDDDGGLDRGAVYLVSLDASGGVASARKVSSLSGGFPLRLRNADWFGSSVAALGDLNGDGMPDLAIGARMDDDMGGNRGAVYVGFLAGQAAFRAEAPAARAPRAAEAPAGNALRLVEAVPAPGERWTLRADRAPFGTRVRPRLVLAGARLERALPCGLGLDPRTFQWPHAVVPGEDPTRSVALAGPEDREAPLYAQLVWLDPATRVLAFSDVLVLGAEDP